MHWQLGFRTVGDAIESGRREITALNVTGLDRELLRKMSPTSEDWGSIRTPEPTGSELQQIKASQLQARLGILAKLDLAVPSAGGHWNIRTDFHQSSAPSRPRMIASGIGQSMWRPL